MKVVRSQRSTSSWTMIQCNLRAELNAAHHGLQKFRKKEEEDVAMDLESSDEDESSPPDLEEVRRRLLAQLDHDEGDEEERDKEEALREAETRAKMNMRATINMVLTVTGDFYGQRDLLEFREPFGAM